MDLKGASIDWASKEKSSKKNVMEVNFVGKRDPESAIITVNYRRTYRGKKQVGIISEYIKYVVFVVIRIFWRTHKI